MNKTIFKNRLAFLEESGSQHNCTEGTGSFRIPAALSMRKASPTIAMPCQSGSFLTVQKPAPTHHPLPESIVHIGVHSWRWTFCGFGQMCNDMLPTL